MNDRGRVIKLVVLERINEFIVVAESIADRSPNNVGFARARVSINDQDVITQAHTAILIMNHKIIRKLGNPYESAPR